MSASPNNLGLFLLQHLIFTAASFYGAWYRPNIVTLEVYERGVEMLAGVDGYKKRWLAALADEDGATRLELFGSFVELVQHPELKRVVIDVPLGLPETGPRRCDLLARKLLGPRRNSVFPAPIRPMLGAATYEEACERRRQAEGKGCSKQLFGILPLIEAADEAITPALQDRLREGHPEVSFTALSGQPMRAHKAKPEGQAQRRDLLGRVFPDLEQTITQFRHPGAVADILDAYVLLWSAQRLERGVGRSLPPELEYDPRGLRMEIVY